MPLRQALRSKTHLPSYNLIVIIETFEIYAPVWIAFKKTFDFFRQITQPSWLSLQAPAYLSCFGLSMTIELGSSPEQEELLLISEATFG